MLCRSGTALSSLNKRPAEANCEGLVVLRYLVNILAILQEELDFLLVHCVQPSRPRFES